MNLCKVMKRRQQQVPVINSLPQELVVDIIASVAASSLSDLCNVKLTCKEFHEAARDDYVFQRASIEALPTIEWRTSSQASLFLKQCEASGNPDAVYKRGMIEYFSRAHIQLGINFLKRAANSGHLESTYVLGIILYSNESSQEEGMELLKKVKSTNDGGIDKCLMRSMKVLREMWINNTIPLPESKCVDPTCRNRRMHVVPNVIDHSWGNQCKEPSFCSQTCNWDHELNKFCNFLRGV
ncbi:F-box protein At2g35280-like [Magnolia sinica]|uniref:F-box protein At2g35280-like n=1 Tax=Magnolia sinica TaxID=86752 RepID=UPI00265AADC4|nr:F-box protein At2g35280-like [Magnolia sinica]